MGGRSWVSGIDFAFSLEEKVLWAMILNQQTLWNAQRNQISDWQKIITRGRAFPGVLSNNSRCFPPSRLSPLKNKLKIMYLGLNPAKSASHPTRGDELRGTPRCIFPTLFYPNFLSSGCWFYIFPPRDFFFPQQRPIFFFFCTFSAFLGSSKFYFICFSNPRRLFFWAAGQNAEYREELMLRKKKYPPWDRRLEPLWAQELHENGGKWAKMGNRHPPMCGRAVSWVGFFTRCSVEVVSEALCRIN